MTMHADIETGTEIEIPLNRLKKSPKNARKVPHASAAIEALAASISAKKMLQKPVVEPERDEHGALTGYWLVTIGEGRRLALRLLAQRKQIKKTHPVLCTVEGPVDRRTTSPDRLTAPASPYVVQAGAVIPAALLTGIRSDLPGQIVGQVTQNVYDSPTGRFLLIPQGSRLVGLYENRIAFGQTRILLAWTRLILPDGRSLVLEKLPAGDASGYAGLEDQVDRHWSGLFGMAALSTLLGVGAELGASDDENEILQALRTGVTGTFNQVGQQAVGKGLSIAPTLTIRPGAPVRVMVTRDLVLQPYGS